ncbi:MAG: ubiquinol-cytochrome c reductase iron-sulfur subunit [Haloarculaceae archaeon]
MTRKHDDAADDAGDSLDDTDSTGASLDGTDSTGNSTADGGRTGGVADLTADARAATDRRTYAKMLATAGGVTALSSLVAPLAGLTRVFEREYTGPIFSDGVFLVDDEGNRLGLDALDVGEKMTVFPETHPSVADAPTLLIRREESQYGGSTQMGFLVEGYAAYSKVCTHAGCMVSDEDDGTLICPCHIGKYDPENGAKVVGGPPPRALPQLPITVSSEGYLMATGTFEGPIGPGGG